MPATRAAPDQAVPRPLARLEPAAGTYFGVNLDWGQDSAVAFNSRLGMPAAAYVQFTHFPVQSQELLYLDQFIEQVAEVRGLAVLTLEPDVPLDLITPQVAGELAGRLADYNARGVPVFVRFAHEMNGSWYAWGQQPSAYVQAFRTLADAVHRGAPGSAMLWAPNFGGGYPFQGGPFEAQPSAADFATLDTNKDGHLDGRDDPYASYYPGDDAVDWVGMSLYHWGDTWPWGKNVVPASGEFAAQLTGTYAGAGDGGLIPNFYHEYAQEHGKPVAIVETAALYNTSVGGDDELRIKQLWWQQVLSAETLARFPSIKMVNWFEWRKPESEIGDAVIDWTVTLNPQTRSAFAADLPRTSLLFATDLPRALPQVFTAVDTG